METNVAVTITKACCVLHNFVRRRDGYKYEDTLNCNMDSLIDRRGVGNSQTNAKDVREYFVTYVNDPNHALSWRDYWKMILIKLINYQNIFKKF